MNQSWSSRLRKIGPFILLATSSIRWLCRGHKGRGRRWRFPSHFSPVICISKIRNLRPSRGLFMSWKMPTVLTLGPYRFHFFSEEGNEPPHIHIRFEGNDCKFWLNPVASASNRGIPTHRLSSIVYRLNEIERLVHEHRNLFIKKYNEHRDRQH